MSLHSNRYEDLSFSKICAAADHSASLVMIADQLSDPPFGRFHRCLGLSFNIIIFGSLGDVVQLRRTARRHANYFFYHRFNHFLQCSAHWNKRRGWDLLATH
ncbi:hypothetical protein H5410_046619 [Solanum commersonii]|uniref:Uncharacterized protein n=1 Tax=Solanum commersonii TaxID=4109 RepID=A0A9J5XCS4_SOLCO|nr:hypothetical protein H5410_046619 [Solanum commersonii]